MRSYESLLRDAGGGLCDMHDIRYRLERLIFLARKDGAEQAEQEPVALIEECREALAQELMAYDIDPPIHHVKQAHDKCVAWLFNRTAHVRTKDLTNDEIMKINVDTAAIVPTCDRQFHFARAVIAADRELNE